MLTFRQRSTRRVATRLQPSRRARPGPLSSIFARDKRQPSHLQFQDKSLGDALDSVDEPGVGPGVTDNLEKAAKGAKVRSCAFKLIEDSSTDALSRKQSIHRWQIQIQI
jgi:hypothetical protein